jgi:hypothetical protein
MDRKTAKMVGAAVALIAVPSAAGALPAHSPVVPIVHSYAELLEPISDATALLAASNAEASRAKLIEAQYDVPNDQYGQQHHHQQYDQQDHHQQYVQQHHHHHHHVRHTRSWYRHNGYYWNGGRWVLRPRSHHHHHHHHSNY